MARYLYRIGRFAFRQRWYVLFVWVAVVIGVVVVGLGAPSAPSGNNGIPGAEFQNANNLIQSSFHADPNAASAQIVFVAPQGQKITATRYEKVIDAVFAEAARSPQVASSDSPVQTHQVSQDGSTAIADINYKVDADHLTPATTGTLTNAVQVGRNAGMRAAIGGDAISTKGSFPGVIYSLAIAAIILLITFGALAAAGMPLLTAGIGVALSLFGIIALSKPLNLSSSTQSLALMLGLAVGIDYALFIVSRYREERAHGREPQEAAGIAVGTAGAAVVFAGLTVMIALAGLAVVGIPLATKMGLAASASVAVSVLVALTLVPALLGFWPRAVLPRAARKPSRRPARASGGRPNMGSRWASFVQRYPLPLLLLAAVGLGVLALPALHLRLGDAGNAVLPASSTQRLAYDDISRAFGPGYNGQLTVVVSTGGARDPKAAVSAVAGKIRATPGVVKVSPAQFDQAGDVAIVNVIPAGAPDSPQTTTLVHAIRAERPSIKAATGATYLVTSLTAANIDIAAKVSGALFPYLVTVMGLAFLLLLVVFRSVLVPLKATLGFVLSVLATLGALVAVFQWGWLGGLLGVPAGPIQSFFPVFLVGISFGLAMDYEVFLVSRIREAHTRGEDARAAVVSGFRHSARVVTAAALIMISVFAGFFTSSDPLVKEIGFGLATAVLLDAFVVRMTIVPAVLAVLGKAAWWRPNWLERVLPRVDIEGQALEQYHAGPQAATDTPADVNAGHADSHPLFGDEPVGHQAATRE